MALPLIFIFFFISLPVNMNVKWVITLAFLSGLSVDIFSDTPGLNSLCCTIASALRLPVMRLYVPRDEDIQALIPSPKSVGRSNYIKYLLTMVTLYCFLFYIVLSFEFFNLGLLLSRIFFSSALTFVLMLAFSSFMIPGMSKR